MTKIEALWIIKNESISTKTVSNARAQRLVKALRVFGFDGEELVEALAAMDVCGEDGSPYTEAVKRTW